jgi:hypothetical protein
MAYFLTRSWTCMNEASMSYQGGRVRGQGVLAFSALGAELRSVI